MNLWLPNPFGKSGFSMIALAPASRFFKAFLSHVEQHFAASLGALHPITFPVQHRRAVMSSQAVLAFSHHLAVGIAKLALQNYRLLSDMPLFCYCLVVFCFVFCFSGFF